MTPFGSPDRPIDQFLFDAVQAHSLRTRGQFAEQVMMRYADGTSFTMNLPGESGPRHSLPVIEAPVWPPAEGWAFRPGEASFDGIRFKLTGKPLAILRELAKTPGVPVTAEKLKREAWRDEPELVDTANLHGQVSLLRRKLRTLFELEADVDPIPNVDGAYKLVIH